MEMRQFGSTDMKVSAIGFGGAEIGFEQAAQATVKELLDDALDAGLNVIDTAECYMNSEEMIGATMAGRRKDFYLFTKCGHPDHYLKGDWRPESLLQTIERSLKRLQTDYVDLVQLHSCSEAVLRQGDVISALKQAREKGYTRYIGYSGDGLAARYACESGEFDSLQTSVNIADQEAITLTLPLAREKRMGVIAKRPVANVAWRYPKLPELDYHQSYWQRFQDLKYDFLTVDRKTAFATALRFTLGLPWVDTAIVGSSKPGRWRENAAIWEAGPLHRDEEEAIRTRWRDVSDESWIGQT